MHTADFRKAESNHMSQGKNKHCHQKVSVLQKITCGGGDRGQGQREQDGRERGRRERHAECAGDSDDGQANAL